MRNLHKATLRVLCAGLGSFGHEVYTLDDGALFGSLNFKHAALLAAAFAGKYINVVALFNMKFHLLSCIKG